MYYINIVCAVTMGVQLNKCISVYTVCPPDQTGGVLCHFQLIPLLYIGHAVKLSVVCTGDILQDEGVFLSDFSVGLSSVSLKAASAQVTQHGWT